MLELLPAIDLLDGKCVRLRQGNYDDSTVFSDDPVAMAQQALTAQAACGGRFVLGIGLSHKIVIEDMLGLSYSQAAKQMREYLEVLAPLLQGKPASFQGDLYRVNAGLQVPDAAPVPLIIAALGPLMLRIAGRLADGTATWMTGMKTLERCPTW